MLSLGVPTVTQAALPDFPDNSPDINTQIHKEAMRELGVFGA